MGSEAEQIVLPSGKTATLVATHTLTPINDSQVKVVPVALPSAKVVVVLVGGAGDKKRFLGNGPNHNIQPAEAPLRRFVEHNVELGPRKTFEVLYLGYYEIFEDARIQANVMPSLTDLGTKVYIVGHSLGGWNGAHLSKILTDKGYDVKMLITLDPVGKSPTLELWSKIYNTLPVPAAKKWINIKAQPSHSNITDVVAWAGEKWIITSGPDINVTVDVNHAEAISMLYASLDGGESAFQMLEMAIFEDLSK